MWSVPVEGRLATLHITIHEKHKNDLLGDACRVALALWQERAAFVNFFLFLFFCCRHDGGGRKTPKVFMLVACEVVREGVCVSECACMRVRE